MSGQPLSHWVWGVLASFAGALTALSSRPFKDMTKGEITLALIVGASFAIFVGPLVAWWIFGDDPVDIRLMGGILYLLATGSNILIPMAVKKVGQFFGIRSDEEPRV